MGRGGEERGPGEPSPDYMALEILFIDTETLTMLIPAGWCQSAQ